MKNKLKVSIVVPVFNMEDTITECVSSLVNQSYKNIEIIIVDDGSTDGSLKACKKIASSDKRIKVIHTDNNGSGPARNRGIRESTGDYIYFPDADDHVERDAIEKLVRENCNNQFDLTVFGYKEITTTGTIRKIKTYKKANYEAEELRNDYSKCIGSKEELTIQGAPWNKFFRKQVIKDNNIEFPNLRRHQDEAFIARYMCFANKVIFLDEILYVHYVNDISKVWKKYPVDYYNAAIGLYETRKNTILSWNKKDLKTKEKIDVEYINNIINALELTFSPKNDDDKKGRMALIKKIINESKVKAMNTPVGLGKYQKLIDKLIKNDKIVLLYYILRAKTNMEKTKIYKKLRKK